MKRPLIVTIIGMLCGYTCAFAVTVSRCVLARNHQHVPGTAYHLKRNIGQALTTPVPFQSLRNIACQFDRIELNFSYRSGTHFR